MKRSVVARVSGEGGMNSWNTENSSGSEIILPNTYCNGGYASLYICQNPYRYTKSEPQGKLWTLGDYSVSMGVHQLNKCTTLVATLVIE